ncbi:MAG: acyltransferase [Cellulomonas sp.]
MAGALTTPETTTSDESGEPLAADFEPWSFWRTASDEQQRDQHRRIDALRSHGFVIGADCVVSRLAAVHPDALVLGDRSYVAAHAHLSGDVTIGADCSVNVGVAVRGRVRMGRAVRIGAHASLLGFDHRFDDPDTEMFRQPLRSVGVEIGDDVWLGTHVVVVDGVRIGSHSVVGAGSVVTHDVPAWAVVAGNPARLIRRRREPRARTTRASLAAHGDDARAQVGAVLASAWVDEAYRDSPGARPTVRAHTDAVELADLLTGAPPPQLALPDHVARLRSLQDERTGLVDEPGIAWGRVTSLLDDGQAYHVLDVGYALGLLGSSFVHPPRTLTDLSPAALVDLLDVLPWEHQTWGSGALVDALGTALTWAARRGHPAAAGRVEAVVGWIVAHRDAATGLWGGSGDGLREPVNGTYRLVRGTLAQWGVRVGGERALVDTVLARGTQVLDDPAASACDALDVVHLLWWAGSTGGVHRAPEVAETAAAILDDALARWVPGAGTPFAPDLPPSLQGTEMWLATAWYAADLLGRSDALGYRPRGVHRPEPFLATSCTLDA